MTNLITDYPTLTANLTSEVPIWLIHKDYATYVNKAGDHCRRNTPCWMVFDPDDKLEYGYIACCNSIEDAIMVCKSYSATYEIVKW